MSLPRLATRRLAVAASTTTRRCFSGNKVVSAGGAGGTDRLDQTNSTKSEAQVPNVSKTNETPVSAMGGRGEPYQELVVEGEKKRTMQAPNRKDVWSKSQMPRELAMSGPRFEQTIMEHQVCWTNLSNRKLTQSATTICSN